MSQPTQRFVLFRRGPRIACSHQAISGDPQVFSYEGRSYRLVASLYEHCHLLDNENGLCGFEFHDFGKYGQRLKSSRFLLETTNHEFFDDYFLNVMLRPGSSENLESDCACLIGPLLYHDSEEDYLIVVDDFNLREDENHKRRRFWTSIRFAPVADGSEPKPQL